MTRLADSTRVDRRRVSLTFDNGPTPGVTEHVLEVLADRAIHTTFFVIGEKVADPAGFQLAERAKRDGHWIGNHTFTHSTPLGQLSDAGDVDREIDTAQAAIGPLAHPDRLFRPYGSGGAIDRRLLGSHGRQRMLDDGFTCCLWNCVPCDWMDPDGWVDTCLEMIEPLDWAVVALHDLPTGAMNRLPRMLDQLAAADVELLQDLPDECTPIRRGVPTTSFDLIQV
jgi:peptidoglycan/xylan/chitin deacetylase (PgdA/CDA1 family)